MPDDNKILEHVRRYVEQEMTEEAEHSGAGLAMAGRDLLKILDGELVFTESDGIWRLWKSPRPDPEWDTLRLRWRSPQPEDPKND
jgi:hypothetical protein